MGRIRVLLIDDDEDFYTYFIELVKQNNELIDIIEYCHSGKEALQVIEQVGIDEIHLVLSDIQMGEANGLTLINQIKQNYGAEYLARFIFISAYIQYKHTEIFDIKQALIDAGCILPSFSKPCDFLEIIENIKLFCASILKSNKEQKDLNVLKHLIVKSSTDNDIKKDVNEESSIEERIKDILFQQYNIVVDDSKNTIRYLFEAILLAYEMKNKKLFVMNKIYDILGKKYNTKAHTIEVTIQNGIKEKINETYSPKFFVNSILKLL